MTKEMLKKIKEESEKEIAKLDGYNTYARLRNKLAITEEAKASLGLPYNRDMYLPEKTESDVIMSIYKKYANQIKETDTNGIYIYVATYMPSEFSTEEIEEGFQFEIETEINDPRATHRYFWNIEGLCSKSVNIQDCEEFEKTHTVLYVDNFYEIQEEFIITAVKENQKKAVNKLLQKTYIQSHTN